MSQHGAAGPPLLLNWNISQVFHVGLEQCTDMSSTSLADLDIYVMQ